MVSLSVLTNCYDPRIDSVSAGTLCKSVNTTHRNAVLKWLLESLDLLKIEDRVYFSTVMLADRYCSRISGRSVVKFEGSELQLILLACLCCCLKTMESSLELSVKTFLDHVSSGHVQCKDIFAMETRILQVLDFNVFYPSNACVITESFFFQYFSKIDSHMQTLDVCSLSPLEQQPWTVSLLPDWALNLFHLSIFLLYIISLDITLMHAATPQVLACACIYLASSVTSATNPNGKQQQMHSYTIACIQETGWLNPVNENDRPLNIITLAKDIAIYWEECVDCSDGESNADSPVKSVVNLFSTPKRNCVSKLYGPPGMNALVQYSAVSVVSSVASAGG